MIVMHVYVRYLLNSFGVLSVSLVALRGPPCRNSALPGRIWCACARFSRLRVRRPRSPRRRQLRPAKSPKKRRRKTAKLIRKSNSWTASCKSSSNRKMNWTYVYWGVWLSFERTWYMRVDLATNQWWQETEARWHTWFFDWFKPTWEPLLGWLCQFLGALHVCQPAPPMG